MTLRALLLVLICLAGPGFAAEPQVLIVGTYHFANPGRDLHNIEAVDVLTPAAQQSLARIVDALDRFEPTQVFVEWPSAVTDERYAAYLEERLPTSRNEVVQLGFRLARQRGLTRVHGIDVEGAFPYQAVIDWARDNDRSDRLDANQSAIAAKVKQMDAIQRERGIVAALRYMNSPAALAADQGFYMDLLRFGAGDDQPGAALNAAWFERNIRICARLLQSLRDDDRAVVFFGAGHVPWLQRCLTDTPGISLVDARRHLPAD